MADSVALIDIESWPRKNHFAFYKDFKQPCFNICLTIDITQAYMFAQRNQLSKLHTLLYLSTKASNNVPAFNIRVNDEGKPYRLSHSQPSATIMNDDSLFTFCNFSYYEDIFEFCSHAKKAQQLKVKEPPLTYVENNKASIFYSIIPWLSFTSYSHAYSTECLDIPKIVFGKFTHKKERVLMPISIELNHALADGLDVALYIEKLTTLIKSCENSQENANEEL